MHTSSLCCLQVAFCLYAICSLLPHRRARGWQMVLCQDLSSTHKGLFSKEGDPGIRTFHFWKQSFTLQPALVLLFLHPCVAHLGSWTGELFKVKFAYFGCCGAFFFFNKDSCIWEFGPYCSDVRGCKPLKGGKHEETVSSMCFLLPQLLCNLNRFVSHKPHHDALCYDLRHV